jgi:phosphohistidine phosphatase
MRLYLFQHGESLEKEEDAHRALSEAGVADVERMAAFLARAGVKASRVLHSGKTRARQTAEIVAQSMTDTTLHPLFGIDPLDDVLPIADIVEDWNEDTAIVGHLPFMARLVSYLTVGDPKSEITAYEPGSVVCLERGEHGWEIEWMLRPSLLRGES